MKVLTDFAGQNWLITPAALAVGENPPANIHEQKFLLVLSGVAIANLEGNGPQWLHETLSFLPDMAGPQNSGPLNWAIGRYSIPKPPGQNYKVAFSLEGWAPFVSLGSVFNQNQSVNSGFAVDVWRPNHFDTGRDAFTHLPVNNIFTGINADVAVSDSDAWIYRIGDNVTLLGKLVFLTVPKILFSSNFDISQSGSAPSTTQAVGTARIEGPPKSVLVVDPPFVHSNKWVKITGGLPLASQQLASFVCVLTEVDGAGIYNFSAAVFIPTGSAVASISFETKAAQEFLHIDFTPQNTMRIDDRDNFQFGSFVRDQVFVLQATLTIGATSTALFTVSGGGATGSLNYVMPQPFNLLAPGFGAVRFWKGFGDGGSFDATSIGVTREP